MTYIRYHVCMPWGFNTFTVHVIFGMQMIEVIFGAFWKDIAGLTPMHFRIIKDVIKTFLFRGTDSGIEGEKNYENSNCNTYEVLGCSNYYGTTLFLTLNLKTLGQSKAIYNIYIVT